MEHIIAYISGLPDKVVCHPVRKSDIIRAERALGCRMADDYKSYLLHPERYPEEYGRLTDLCAYYWRNVVHLTQEKRNRYSNLPRDCYVIEEREKEFKLILQNKSGNIFSLTHVGSPKKIANGLKEYLENSKSSATNS